MAVPSEAARRSRQVFTGPRHQPEPRDYGNLIIDTSADDYVFALNQLLRTNTVGAKFFEISTLVPAREFNQQYE